MDGDWAAWSIHSVITGRSAIRWRSDRKGPCGIAVPEWIGVGPAYHWNAEAARSADVGLRFWGFVTTGPLTLLMLANLAAAWLTRGPERRWWLGAALAALVDRAFTFAYFIPTMLKLMREDGLAESQATALALPWANLNDLRLATVLAAWLAAL